MHISRQTIAAAFLLVGSALPSEANAASGPAHRGAQQLAAAETAIPELDPAIARRLKPADFVTKADLAGAPVRFRVPGRGLFELKDIQAPGGATCRMHLPSVARALSAKGGTGEGPAWINLSIYTINGKTHCFWPPNGACYAMVLKVAS